jgi:[DsrC]-trisulfide reductase subunit O
MKKSRRDFLKIAGLSALGLGAGPTLEKVAKAAEAPYEPNPKALKAKRWAMVIDIKKFRESGEEALNACITACHTVHNVPDFGNPKDAVKWLWKAPFGEAFPSQEHAHLHELQEHGMKGVPSLVLCNHCDNPPCVRVCPTKATFRRADGLVLMDFHRCIGCRYCMAACPFGARSLNWRDPRDFIKTKLNREYPTRTRGVVEKCNFCAERLAVGKMPACVEACKNGEMAFGDLEDANSEVRELLRTHFAIRRKPQLGTHPQVYYIV